MKVHLFLVVLTAFCCHNVQSKLFKKCDFFNELQEKYGLQQKKVVAALTCLGDELSQLDTSYATSDNYSRYFGVFLLEEKETCSFQKPGKCGVTCDKFLDDNILDDLECLFEVFLSDFYSPHSLEYRACRKPKRVDSILDECGGNWTTENEIEEQLKVVTEEPEKEPVSTDFLFTFNDSDVQKFDHTTDKGSPFMTSNLEAATKESSVKGTKTSKKHTKKLSVTKKT